MNKRNILLTFSLLFTMFIFSTCTENILRDDCKDLDEIEFVIKGQYATECEPGDLFPARGASFKIIVGKDTLATGNLDETGMFETGPIENSSCGLNNLKIETSYNGKSVSETFGVLCCDTTLTYIFKDITCQPADSIDCASIDTTIVKNITSSGECVLQTAQFSDLENNSVVLSSSTKLRINISNLNNFSDKIYVESMTPAATGDSVTLENSQLEIYFNVDRSVPDTIKPVTVKLPADCLDENGAVVNSGTITITLSTTVCDPSECYCPFGNSGSADNYYAPEKVILGSSESFTFKIIETSTATLGEGCLLQIDSIKRADGTSVYDRGTNSWVIETTALPKLASGESFEISANFEPSKAGEVTEAFEVYTSVYSESNPTIKKNDKTCSYKFNLKAEGCELICPTIQILAANAKRVNSSTGTQTALSVGEKTEMDATSYILQKIKGVMANDCLNELKEGGVAAFKFDLPDGDYCSDIQLKVTKQTLGTADDRKYFNAASLPEQISETGGTSTLTILFSPPDIGDYFDDKHDSIYKCAFIVEATDGSGNKICSQEIHIEAQVCEFSQGSREVVIMEAFSQISNYSSVPSYHIYDIDEFNPKLKNYGLREALTSGYIDYSKVPNVPVSAHSLYFDVDSPNDPALNFTQKPELYLVNSSDNNFSMITSEPVAAFDTHDAFIAAYENGSLMSMIMTSPKNTGTPEEFSWSEKRSSYEFPTLGGLQIQPYNVYVVWDPTLKADKYTTSTGNKYIYCGIALIYVASVESGDDNTGSTGGMGKASVSFYVEYPLQYEE